MASKQKRPAANTAAAQTEALAEVAAGYPAPPAGVTLTGPETVRYEAILKERLPGEWSAVDCLHAAQLARTFSELERVERRVRREGAVLANEKSGARKAHPLLQHADALQRRTVALTRLLQLHAIARVGPTRDQGVRKAEALKANRTLEQTSSGGAGGESFDEDDLLAKPTRSTTH